LHSCSLGPSASADDRCHPILNFSTNTANGSYQGTPAARPGSPEEVWVQFHDVAVPMRPYIDSFSREQRAAAFEEALAMLPPNRMPDLTELTVAMHFASAAR
jgi:hypothetical protein